MNFLPEETVELHLVQNSSFQIAKQIIEIICTGNPEHTENNFTKLVKPCYTYALTNRHKDTGAEAYTASAWYKKTTTLKNYPSHWLVRHIFIKMYTCLYLTGAEERGKEAESSRPLA